jgi:hypothetical protein
MFALGPATRVYLAAGATDMRKGFDGLYGLVRDQLELDPESGHLFLFSNRRRTRLKRNRQAIPWSGSGGGSREAAQAAGVREGRVAWGRSARPGSTSAR